MRRPFGVGCLLQFCIWIHPRFGPSATPNRTLNGRKDGEEHVEEGHVPKLVDHCRCYGLYQDAGPTVTDIASTPDSPGSLTDQPNSTSRRASRNIDTIQHHFTLKYDRPGLTNLKGEAMVSFRILITCRE